MAGIYLHIPFCRQACHYCDFHFSTSMKNRDGMIDAMLTEIENNREYFGGESVSTIYFGGGTPSLLNETDILSLLSKIRSTFPVEDPGEITLEANPDDLSPARAKSLKSAGINRLSIGIQSFRDEDLRLLHRVHNASLAHECMGIVKDAGFENISADLIYGIPGLGEDAWRGNLAELFSYRPQHISAYALTIEEKTVFGKRYSMGRFKPADEESVVSQFRILTEESAKQGYEHYEISNLSLPGHYSKHNTSYWFGKKYLGIGPSAHSFNGTSRRWNVRNNAAYISKIKGNEICFEEEILEKKDRFNEIVFTSLRTKWGLDLILLESSYPWYYNGMMTEAAIHIEAGNLRIEGGKLLLSEKGKLVADKVSSDLFTV